MLPSSHVGMYLSTFLPDTHTHTQRGNPGQPCACTTVWEENTLWCRGSPARLHPPHPGMITCMGNRALDFLRHSCTHTNTHWCQCTHKHRQGSTQVQDKVLGLTGTSELQFLVNTYGGNHSVTLYLPYFHSSSPHSLSFLLFLFFLYQLTHQLTLWGCLLLCHLLSINLHWLLIFIQLFFHYLFFSFVSFPQSS